MPDRKLRLLLTFLILATGWRLCIFFDHSFWQSFIMLSGNRQDLAWLVYSIALYAGMFVAAWLVHEKNVRGFSTGFMTAALALSILMRVFPQLQAFYVSYALLGAATGLYFATFAFYGGYGVMPEKRISFHAVIVLGFSIVVYGFMYLFDWLPFDLAFALLCAILGGAIVLNFRYTLPPRCASTISTSRKVPNKLIIACGLALFLGYFVSYLNQGGVSISDLTFTSLGLPWLDLAMRALACVVIIFLGRRLKISHLLYATNASFILTLILNMLKIEINVPVFIMANIAFILGQISFYTLFTAIMYKFGRQSAVFALLVLCVGVGIVGGQAAGRGLSLLLEKSPTLLFVVSLLLANGAFIILPFIFRSIRSEVDLERELSPGFIGREPASAVGPQGSESESIVFRKQIACALRAFNVTFDAVYRLTPRELEVAAYCVERFDYMTIGEKLGISQNTVKAHIKNIYAKYDIRSRKELAQLLEQQIESVG